MRVCQASFPVFVCGYEVRQNKTAKWGIFPTSFPSQDSFPIAALPLYVLVTILQKDIEIALDQVSLRSSELSERILHYVKALSVLLLRGGSVSPRFLLPSSATAPSPRYRTSHQFIYLCVYRSGHSAA